MANSKYEYVRTFERDEVLLPNTWIVVRVDGRGFHKLSEKYKFLKPNDPSALNLMNHAATSVFKTVSDICIAYGVSDEYSFVFHKNTMLFERRAAKLVSTVVSAFTAAYVFGWDGVMNGGDNGGEERPLMAEWLPTFDGRVVCYPDLRNLRDYLSWRQVDCHINNLYNTTFWAMVQQGNMSATAAEEELKGTFAADKNEILFSRFGINYNNEPDMYRKGSVVFKEYEMDEVVTSQLKANDDRLLEDQSERSRMQQSIKTFQGIPRGGEQKLSKTQQEKVRKAKQKAKVVVKHVDIIKDDFWDKYPWILNG